jgi:hypothetical protein
MYSSSRRKAPLSEKPIVSVIESSTLTIRQKVPPKRLYTSAILHCVTSYNYLPITVGRRSNIAQKFRFLIRMTQNQVKGI